MYFKNDFGSAYILENKIAVLNTAEGKYTFESSDPYLVRSSYNDFIAILKILEIDAFVE